MTLESSSSSPNNNVNVDPDSTPTQLLTSLRNIRNSVIGSRTRKSNLASKGLLPYFSALLVYPIPVSHPETDRETKGKNGNSWTLEDSLEIRSLAATILGSVAHGATPPTLLALLRSRVPSSLLQSLSDLSFLSTKELNSTNSTTISNSNSTSPIITNPTYLKVLESLLRAYRSLLLSLADELSPSNRWGIGNGWGVGNGTSVNLTKRNNNSNSSNSNMNQNSSSSMTLSGRSSREKNGWEVADSNGKMGDCDCDFFKESYKGKFSWDTNGLGYPRLIQRSVVNKSDDLEKRENHEGENEDQDVLMKSKSFSNLHETSKNQSQSQSQIEEMNLDHPLDPYFELIHNSRITITKIFSSRFLPLLIGALFLVDDPIDNDDDGKNDKFNRDSNSNLIGLSRPMTPVDDQIKERNPDLGIPRSSARPSENGRSSSSHMKIDSASSNQMKSSSTTPLSRSSSGMSLDVGSSKPNENQLPLTTKARILSITELVCAILSRCIGVCGIGPFNLKGIQIEIEVEEMKKMKIDTPFKELEVRRERILDFKAKDSPWRNNQKRDSNRSEEFEENDNRGRSFNRNQSKDEDVEMDVSSSTDSDLNHPHLQATLLRSSRSTSRSKSSPAQPTARSNSRARSQSQNQDDVEMSGSIAQSNFPTTKLEEMREGTEEGLETILDNRGILESLLQSIECGFGKTQEAALWALAELIRENSSAGIRLFRLQTHTGLLPTSMLLNFRKEPSASLRLAAFSCLTHIIKLHPFTPRTNNFVLHALIELLDHSGDVQVQATFAIARLVSDDYDLQLIACESYDAIKKLAGLLEKSSVVTTPGYGYGSGSMGASNGRAGVAVDEGLIRLREGTLLAFAALTNERDDLRHLFVDYNKPSLLPLILPSLTASSLGIRITACRLIKSLSRSVRILRTSLIDSGVAEKLLFILKSKSENKQVKIEAMNALSNLVMKFSPMKKYLIENGAIEKLAEIVKGEDNDNSFNDHFGRGEFNYNNSNRKKVEGSNYSLDSNGVRVIDGSARFNGLWVFKNILYSTEIELKKKIMDLLGWDYLASLALSSTNTAANHDSSEEKIPEEENSNHDIPTQEQALTIIRNLASAREEDVKFCLNGFGGEKLLDLLENVIWQQRDDGVLQQAAFILVNVANGNEEHRRLILDRPNLLDAILYFLKHPKAEIRSAGCWVSLKLTDRGPIIQPPKPNLSTTFSAWAPSPRSPAPASSTSASPSNPTIETDSTSNIPIEELALDRLKAFGFEAQVRELTMDEELDVRDRAKALLIRFE